MKFLKTTLMSIIALGCTYIVHGMQNGQRNDQNNKKTLNQLYFECLIERKKQDQEIKKLHQNLYFSLRRHIDNEQNIQQQQSQTQFYNRSWWNQ